MTLEIAAVLVVTGMALALFISERFPVDVTALLLMLTLMGLHLLGTVPGINSLGLDFAAAFPSVQEGLSGLSNPATVTVLAMFVLSAGVQRTGVIDLLGRRMVGWVGQRVWQQLIVIAIIVAPVSAFINNTAAVAMLLPLIVDVARRTDTAASKLLIPLSFFAMMGGTITLIGTSTNVLAASLLVDLGGPRLSMFDFSLVGLMVFATGLVYFLLVGQFLLPNRKAASSDEGGEKFLIEIRIPNSSPLVGQTLNDSGFLAGYGLDLRRLIRGNRVVGQDPLSEPLERKDVLLVDATQQSVVRLAKEPRVRLVIKAPRTLRRQLLKEGVAARVVLNSPLTVSGRHASEMDFSETHGAALVGVQASVGDARRLGNMVLKTGHVALLWVPSSDLGRVGRRGDVLLLDHVEDEFDRSKTTLALSIVAAVIAAAALTPVPVVYAALLGAAAMILTGCLTSEQAYGHVSWNIVFLLAGVIPLGIAITKSGTADWLAGLLAGVSGHMTPFLFLVLLYAVTTILTEIVSNNAAVAILVPVAVAVGKLAELSPMPLVLAVMFAASTSFLSPIGYQTNTMIYGVGVYRFGDFFKVGAPLNLILAFVTCWAIQAIFPISAA